MTLGAAVAFYTALSLAPLLMILIALAGLIGVTAQHELVHRMELLVGPKARDAIEMIIANAGRHQKAGKISVLVGGLTLFFSASGVFAQLQFAMNRIWDVRAKPGLGVWGWLRKRLLSLGMVIAIGLLIFVSLILNVAIDTALAPTGQIWKIINIIGSWVIFTLVFAVIFKLLPDVKIIWKDVWVGAAITTVLFVLGKFGISKYLGYSTVGSAYGAAGSLVVFLVWVYYCSLIVFFGAELTQVYARRHGSPIVPDRHAEWVDGAKRRNAG